MKGKVLGKENQLQSYPSSVGAEGLKHRCVPTEGRRGQARKAMKQRSMGRWWPGSAEKGQELDDTSYSPPPGRTPCYMAVFIL